MHHMTARCATPLKTAWLPLMAVLLLLPGVAPRAAAEDGEVPVEQRGERLSDAPWRLANRTPHHRHPVQIELLNNPSARPALDFQRPSKSQSLPVGQLRMTLSDTSSLSFRPRSGGMHVTYREKF